MNKRIRKKIVDRTDRMNLSFNIVYDRFLDGKRNLTSKELRKESRQKNIVRRNLKKGLKNFKEGRKIIHDCIDTANDLDTYRTIG